ncbi:hypothetical protein HPB48_023591 [Haemaphysalis longicornis]|uniref:C2H2-type domain-containing protein n=1 Tax=Haemaphysalis longicornis TaxID=44386 RepID=A0A9J6H7D1_HAELO|nr:hypothetical protein HPB48_023591 [Haemaphysalis longicornis]
MRIRRTVNLCAVCGATLGAKPTLHPCLANGRAVAAPTQQRYQCSECPQSFPSKKGLNNHLQWHSKEEAKRLRAESSRPVTDQLPATPATAAEVDNVEGQQNETTPTFQQPAKAAPPLIPRSEGKQVRAPRPQG